MAKPVQPHMNGLLESQNSASDPLFSSQQPSRLYTPLSTRESQTAEPARASTNAQSHSKKHEGPAKALVPIPISKPPALRRHRPPGSRAQFIRKHAETPAQNPAPFPYQAAGIPDYPVVRHQTSVLGRLADNLLAVPALRLGKWIGVLAVVFGAMGQLNAQLYWNTNGVTGNWTDSNWGSSSGGPFTTGFTNNTAAIFTANSTVNGRTTSTGNITVNPNVIVSFPAGTGSFGTGGNVRTFDVGAGGVLDFGSINWSSSTGTGIIKEGQGILKLSGDSPWVGGSTLNNGTIIYGGVNAMGGGTTNTLTINGGTIAANANRDLTGKYGGGITIGGNFNLGAVTTGVPSGNGSATANIIFSNNISLGANTRTITIGANGTYTLGGVISTSGSAGLTINATAGATGTLVLGSANTYTGTTTLNGGTLSLNSINALQNSTLDTGASGSQVVNFIVAGTNTYNLGGLAGSDDLSLGANTISVGSNNADTTYSAVMSSTGGGLTKVGTGTLTLSGSNTYTGTTTINAGNLTLGANDRISNSSAVTISGGTLNLSTYNDTVGAFTITSGNLAGSGTLTGSSYALQGGTIAANLGTGTITVTSGTTTLSGTAGSTAINITSGNLTLGAADRLDNSATVTVAGGVLHSGSFTDTVSALNMSSGSISGSGTLTAATYGLSGGTVDGTLGAGTATVTGAVSLVGTMAPTTLNVNTGGTLTLGSANRIGNSSAVNIGGGTLDLGSYNDTVGAFTITSGTLNGSGTLTGSSYALQGGTVNAKLGAGAITVSSSTTTLGSAGRLDATSTLTVNSGQLNLGGNEAVAGLSGSGGTLNLGSYTLTANLASNTTFSGSISGSGGALTKNGTGTLTLSGSNSYSGATTINSGTLNAAHASALGSTSGITVNNGGSLLVSADDAINGNAITLASTSTTVAGLVFSGTYDNTSGQAGTLTLSQNSIIDLGTGSVIINFASITGLDTYTLSIYNWSGTTLWDGGTGNNTDQFYANGSALTQSQLNHISFYSGGLGTSSFMGSGYQIIGGSFANQVIPVPEPEAIATAAALLAGAVFMILRRRHGAPAGEGGETSSMAEKSHKTASPPVTASCNPTA